MAAPPKHTSVLSVVVVTYRRRQLLEECLLSVERALSRVAGPTELVVVDNGSRDETSSWVRRRFPEASVVEIKKNIGFTGALTVGIRTARGRWIALLNDDTTIDEEALRFMVDAGEAYPRVGSVAAQMRFADRPDLINSAGLEIDRLGVAADRLVGRSVTESETVPIEVFGTSGGAALYRQEMLEPLGGFDESFFAYMEDADLAWRARMNDWRSVYEPRAVVYHHHSATLKHGSPHKYFLVGRNRVRLLAKNAERRQLIRYGLAMLAYDLAYVLYVGVRDKTLAPLRGRLRGLPEWSTYRRRGAEQRRPVELVPVKGIREALRRYRIWTSRGET